MRSRRFVSHNMLGTLLTDFTKRPELYFAGSITLINLVNIREKKRKDTLSVMRYGTVSVMKGWVYGTFWPISLFGVLSSAFYPESFRTHFVPCSVYGKDEDD